MKAPLRLVFLGSPAFAVPTLAAVREAGHEIALVVSQPDRPAGRGRRMASPQVVEYAREAGLPVWQTSTLKGSETVERLAALGADGMVLAAFAALVPRAILDLTPLGVLNVHPSLLPRWRGAAPIQSAILAGDRETGVSIIRLVQAMDAGPILLQESTPIGPDDDYLSLEPRLARLGARLLVEALAGAADGSLVGRPQDDAQATYCSRIERNDARVEWTGPAEAIDRVVRAFRGWPQAFTTLPDGRLLKLLRTRPHAGAATSGPPGTIVVREGVPFVATGDGLIELVEVVPEGKRPQSGADFLRGHGSLAGARLGEGEHHD